MDNLPAVRKTKQEVGTLYQKQVGPDPLSIYSEQGLLSRALQDRWPIPEETKQEAIAQVTEIIHNSNAYSVNTRLKAIRNLIHMEGLNLKQMSILMPKHHIHVVASELSDEELETAILEAAETIQERRFIDNT